VLAVLEALLGVEVVEQILYLAQLLLQVAVVEEVLLLVL
jgi:hypothetical protein